MTHKRGLLLGAALTGLLTVAACSSGGSTTDSASPAVDSGATGECHGINSCKGTGDCGGKGYSCAGKNACKGQGWLKLKKAECEKKGGKFKADA